MGPMEFIVGSFNQASLYLLQFNPQSGDQQASLQMLREHPAIGAHSWLSFSPDKRYVYTTVWSEKPTIAVYKITTAGRDIQFINAKYIKARSGYVCANSTHVFSVGGPSGEVFRLEADGAIGDLVQELDFVTDQGENHSAKRGEVAHGDFGGVRHGAHSVDLSPDGKSLYIADIGRNCVWTYSVLHSRRGIPDPPLKLATKSIAPRVHDGPRHTWPHPNGRALYSLQEHSSMVDVFAIGEDGVTLEHKQGVQIIPAGRDCKHYWADEVRVSTGPDPSKPRYLYASTRGLEAETRGYVAVFRLNERGLVEDEQALDIWETPTSGGFANAIEPAPWDSKHGNVEYLAMTDSQEGWVFVLSFDGTAIREVSRVKMGENQDGTLVQPATAIWI